MPSSVSLSQSTTENSDESQGLTTNRRQSRFKLRPTSLKRIDGEGREVAQSLRKQAPTVGQEKSKP